MGYRAAVSQTNRNKYPRYVNKVQIDAELRLLTIARCGTTVARMTLRPNSRLGRRIRRPILIEDRTVAVRPSHAAEESSRVATRSERFSAGS